MTFSKRISSAILVIVSTLFLVNCSDNSSNSETATADNSTAAISTSENTESKEAAADPVELVVYSSRKEHLIKPLFDLYTEETGVKISYITDKAGPLIARIKAEGENSPVDLFITVDAGNLWFAAESGILQPVESDILTANIPARLRDEKNRWFGLSERARTIVYSTERAKPEELSTYEALADEAFKGRLCLRTSKKVYNQSLVATMINRLGEEAAENVVKGWVGNLATDVFSNDTKTMEAVLAGRCDVAVVNTYYYGRLEEKDPNIPLKLFWPNQASSGVHVNVSGAGIAVHSKKTAQAKKLLEWLASKTAQTQFAQLNHEYPVLNGMAPTGQVQAWGEFKRDPVNIAVAGQLQVAAVKLMDRAGYR